MPASSSNSSGVFNSSLADEILLIIARSLSIFVSIFIFLHISLITDFWSSVSYIVKLLSYPILSMYLLKILTHVEWNVLTHTAPAPCATVVSTRSFISLAALLVNVIAIILYGSTPHSSIKYAILFVSTRVFPEPAPAIISSAPSVYLTALFWLSFKSSNLIYPPLCKCEIYIHLISANYHIIQKQRDVAKPI